MILSPILPSGSGCGHLVGRGTRFNAPKTHSGNYMSSKISEFIMKCRSCAKSVFIIRTNPALQSFDYVRGIQKRSSKEDQQLSNAHPNSLAICSARGDDLLISQRRAVKGDEQNPIDQLDWQAHGQRKSITELQQLEALQNVQMVNWKDDAATNAMPVSSTQLTLPTNLPVSTYGLPGSVRKTLQLTYLTHLVAHSNYLSSCRSQ